MGSISEPSLCHRKEKEENPQEKSWANISSQSQLGCWVSIHRNQVPALSGFRYFCSFNCCGSHLRCNEIEKHAWIISMSQEGEGEKIPKRRVEQTSLLKVSWVVQFLSTEIKSPGYAVSNSAVSIAAVPNFAVTKLGYCYFFPRTTRTLWMKLQNPNDTRNSQNLTLYTPADDVPLSLDFWIRSSNTFSSNCYCQ